MSKIDIAGLKVDSISKQQLLDTISLRLKNDQKTFVITPYSEFLYRSLRNPELLELFNGADFSVPDGIGIFWAAKYLSIPLTAKSYFGKILQSFWQIVYSGAAILLYPRYIRSAFPQKISGSDLVWNLAKLAQQNNLSIYFLGGFGNVTELAAKKVSHALEKNGTQFDDRQIVSRKIIAGWSNKNPDDPTIVDDIKKSGADFVFVAYGPVKQEQWIVKHKDLVAAKLFIGLGGTFDYLAGKQTPPPHWMRSVGLEWMWRLLTQPKRITRIWQATVGLTTALLRYKIFRSYPLRQNALCVVINNENKILVCQRNPNLQETIGIMYPEKFQNYWQFPQGGLEKNEDVVAGAKRELMEETGLHNIIFLKISDKKNIYFWNNASRRVVGRRMHASGQSQSIVYFRFSGTNSEIHLDNREFIDHKWVSAHDLVDAVHSERKNVAAIIIEDLKNIS